MVIRPLYPATGGPQLQAVASGAASIDLIKQLRQLRLGRRCTSLLLEPVAQHVRLTGSGQRLQGRQHGRDPHGLQVLVSELIQQNLRLCRVAGAARRCARDGREA